MVAVARDAKEADEPLKAVEPESWLVRGALFMVPGMPPKPFDAGKTGAVFVLDSERGACAILSHAIRSLRGSTRGHGVGEGFGVVGQSEKAFGPKETSVVGFESVGQSIGGGVCGQS